MGNTIILRKNGPVAEIEFNRPQRHNAYTLEMLDELEEALLDLKQDRNIRVTILYGGGETSFSSGGDIDTVFDGLSCKRASILVRRIQDVFSMIETLPMVAISAINGYCFGGGLEIALASDIRIASKSALFGLPEVTVGILSGAGGTQRIIRYIGNRSLANEILMAGRKINAQEAVQNGLISGLYESNEELLAAARAMAEKICKTCSPTSIEAIKKCVVMGQDMNLESGLRFEGEQWAMLFGTPDQLEGVAAFQARRKPAFPGRADY